MNGWMLIRETHLHLAKPQETLSSPGAMLLSGQLDGLKMKLKKGNKRDIKNRTI